MHAMSVELDVRLEPTYDITVSAWHWVQPIVGYSWPIVRRGQLKPGLDQDSPSGSVGPDLIHS